MLFDGISALGALLTHHATQQYRTGELGDLSTVHTWWPLLYDMERQCRKAEKRSKVMVWCRAAEL